MTARKDKTEETPAAESTDVPAAAPEEILTVAKPHGLESVYVRAADGTVTREVRKATPAEESAEPAAED